MARVVWALAVGQPMELSTVGTVTMELQHKSGRAARILFSSVEQFTLRPPPDRYFDRPPSAKVKLAVK